MRAARDSMQRLQRHGCRVSRTRCLSQTTTKSAGADVGAQASTSIQRVKGKTVIITGGSQGCGRAAALKFAELGYNVVVAARQQDRLERVAELVIQKAGNRPGAGLAVATDITDASSVQALAAEVARTYESVDVLVNNAGVCCTGPFADTTMEDWNAQLQVNCLGAVAVTQAFLPKIEASKGSIVCVNSFGGVMPLRNMTAYTASKFALAGFADALRYEMKPKGVHVAQVHPGVINSDFMERAQFRGEDSDAQRARMAKMLNTGMGGMVQKPEEIADAVIDAVQNKKDEVIVGTAFKAIVAGYRLTGVNPFGVEAPNL
eukprot:CAMPEP_0114281500 /NCGR_PEP_ID=MMETSP0059-20121206/3035_1 /TAXON_ID=36894 /ORGANISM="Pyramimonas parkeae, Strain CCMP726" /LENGTH=317 /DNA_ID=CAMNT_0001402033 /DNA_START=153 /DNA_END=1106 /DNA_ORIENTATION=-